MIAYGVGLGTPHLNIERDARPPRTPATALRIQDDARKPCFIETVPRRGYRFIAGGPPNVPPARPDASTTAERALREIREMLLLMIERPHEAHGAAARITDYIAAWAPKTANEG